MRCQKQLGMGAQRRIGRKRLCCEGIQRRAGQMTFVEHPDQGILIDQATARCIDQICALLHPTQIGLAEDVRGFLGAGHVKGDGVGPRQQVLQ